MNMEYGMFFPISSNFQILGYTDAGWAGYVDTRKSTSGDCFLLVSSMILWKVKKPQTISRSSLEVECRALGNANCELICLLYVLRDLHV